MVVNKEPWLIADLVRDGEVVTGYRQMVELENDGLNWLWAEG
jgi:hypothetical protein